MTSPSGMSCETCRDLLIELVCDELTAETAAAVRAHALKCERCGQELEKLSGTLAVSSSLALLSPSPEVERRIMQAAREAIAGRARGPARESTTQAAGYGVTAWFARLGSFAMSPQVAMASVLLLVVGIGLYALPFGRDAEPSALRATEDEAESEHSPAASPAASATATPLGQPEARQREEEQAYGRSAAERDLLERAAAVKKTSPAQGAKDGAGLGTARLRKADSNEPAKAASSSGRLDTFEAKEGRGGGAQAFPGSKAASAPAAPAKPKAARESQAFSDDLEPLSGTLGARASAPAPAVVEKSNKAEQAAESARAGANSYAPAPPAAAQPKKSAPARPTDDAFSSAGGPKPAEAAAPAQPSQSADKRAKGAATSALEQGIEAVKRGDHAQAETLLKPIAASGASNERGTATLWLARSLRARGDCPRALAYYRVLTQALSAPRAVLEEAADCQARTGNLAAAEKLRARAALPAKQ